jgi:hypothetical protein
MKFILLALAITMICSKAYSNELITFLELEDSTINIEICPGSYPITITRTKVTPTQLQRGDTMKLLLLGSNSVDIVENKIRFISSLDGKELQTDFQDRKGNIIKAGSANKIEITRDTPTVIPSGKWKIVIEELDAKNNVNWCINVSFDF